MLKDKNILLIISGGIAAYKTLELIRLIRKNNGHVRCVLTKGGAQFVTPLSVSALSENKVYDDLWSLTDETEMGHIRLSRENDLIVIAPASADIMAKMAHGLANDLASTTLLASNKPVLIAPAMNPEMWNHPATQANAKTLKERGVMFIGPASGDTACGEVGKGRMSEAEEIFSAITDFFFEKPLKGKSAIVTSGPTYEAIDPVRFIGNRSSGKQGTAIACALRDVGADVTLITGPTNIPAPQGIETINITSAAEMLKACEGALPSDIAICAAAVGDWAPAKVAPQKMKKTKGGDTLDISLIKNPDILHTIANHKKRPALVIGFAAETENLENNAKAKLKSKGCDWIIANEVGASEKGNEKTFGADENQICFITQDKYERWNRMSKIDVAKELVARITTQMSKK